MTQTQPNPDDILAQFVAEALQLGADELDIQYKARHEEVCAMKGSMGFWIATLDSSGAEAGALREQLRTIGKKGKTLNVMGAPYRLNVATYDSFGETAFRVTIGRRPNQ